MSLSVPGDTELETVARSSLGCQAERWCHGLRGESLAVNGTEADGKGRFVYLSPPAFREVGSVSDPAA